MLSADQLKLINFESGLPFGILKPTQNRSSKNSNPEIAQLFDIIPQLGDTNILSSLPLAN